MRGRQEADTAPREPREDHTTSAHPNTVAHSSGAVVCPDEASARRHRDRATWIEHSDGWIPAHATPTTTTWARVPGANRERRWTR